MNSVRESNRVRRPSVPITEIVYLPIVVERVVAIVRMEVSVEPGDRVIQRAISS